mgnify:CR=1 FL=1
MVAELLPDTIDGLLAMLTDALGMKLTLPSINEQYVYTMGKAVVIESGRAETDKAKIGSYALQVKGDSTMVFAAVAQYVGEVFRMRIIRLRSAASSSARSVRNMKIITSRSLKPLRMARRSMCGFLPELGRRVCNQYCAQEDVNPVVAFFAKIAAFFSNLAKKIIALFK